LSAAPGTSRCAAQAGHHGAQQKLLHVGKWNCNVLLETFQAAIGLVVQQAFMLARSQVAQCWMSSFSVVEAPFVAALSPFARHSALLWNELAGCPSAAICSAGRGYPQLVGHFFYRTPHVGEVDSHLLPGGAEYSSFQDSQI